MSQAKRRGCLVVIPSLVSIYGYAKGSPGKQALLIGNLAWDPEVTTRGLPRSFWLCINVAFCCLLSVGFHRVIEGLGLERTSRVIKLQPLCHMQHYQCPRLRPSCPGPHPTWPWTPPGTGLVLLLSNVCFLPCFGLQQNEMAVGSGLSVAVVVAAPCMVKGTWHCMERVLFVKTWGCAWGRAAS